MPARHSEHESLTSQAFVVALGQTAGGMTIVLQAQGACGRIYELLERVPRIPTPRIESEEDFDDETPPKEPLKPPAMEGRIEFQSVDFAYPTRPDVLVLKGFSLSIPAKTTAALVGSSGNGKSTVIALLQRFYDVSGGTVSIDGIDIRDFDHKWLRSHFGFVQQEPVLFGLSIRENVAYGVDYTVTDSEVEEACRKANAHEFISSWPDGYNTKGAWVSYREQM